MGEARRKKLAGNTESSPNYQRRKRIKKSDWLLPSLRFMYPLGLIPAAKGRFELWKGI